MVLDTQTSFFDMISFLLAIVFIVTTILSIVFIIKGGISFILSTGDDEKVKTSIHTIRYAIVGLVIVFLSILVVKVIGALFNVNFLSFLTAENLRETINTIFERVSLSFQDSSELKGVLD
ncbi:hypothetical protein COB57_05845 [Candidatus Peregrinibacteria bacterium]|nr:MAG: hypothetical protein COB57_05845 [Candidatus Peregrinibacteria bacterium]